MKVITTLCLFIWASKLSAQPYSIKGNIPQIKDGDKIYMYHIERGATMPRKESAIFKAGNFLLTGTLEEPGRVVLIMYENNKGGKQTMLETFIGADNMTLLQNDTLTHATIKGSTANADYTVLKKNIEPINNKIMDLYKEMELADGQKDTTTIKQKQKELEQIQQAELKPTCKKFIETRPNSPAALIALETFIGEDLDYNTVNIVWQKIGAKAKATATGKYFKEKMEKAYLTRVGAVAPAVVQKNTDGAEVSLASYKGKFVLVDFWASWCKPCRAENPNVLANYNAYKNKNFDVLGVSLDTNKDRWLNAIKKDNLPWAQISDLKGWKNELVIKYGIESIPQNWLVNPQGIIVARNLAEEKLGEKLAELLK
jgi:peroxiredoxin